MYFIINKEGLVMRVTPLCRYFRVKSERVPLSNLYAFSLEEGRGEK
jgi:hypothetical protein